MYNFTHGHTTNGNRKYATCFLIKNYKLDENIINVPKSSRKGLCNLPITNLQNSSLKIEIQHFSFSVISSAPPVKYMHYFTRKIFLGQRKKVQKLYSIVVCRKRRQKIWKLHEKKCAHILSCFRIRSPKLFLIIYMILCIENN